MPSSAPDETHGRITRSTSVTLGALGLFVASGIAFVGFLTSHFSGVEDRLDVFGDALSEITFSLREIRDDVADLNLGVDASVRGSYFRAWLEVLEARNPTLVVPEFRED